MITKQQTQRQIDKLVAHHDSLKDMLSGLKAHHGRSEATVLLAQAIELLDEAACALMEEIETKETV